MKRAYGSFATNAQLNARWTAVVLTAWLLACGSPEQHVADLTAPQIVDIGSIGRPPHPVTHPIALTFSEPLESSTLDAEGFVVVPHALVGECRSPLDCSAGSCYAGQCQVSPIDDHWRADAANPPLSSSRRQQAVIPRIEVAPDELKLTLEFAADALRPHHLYTLLVATTATDRAGNPLRSSLRHPGLALEHSFVTSGASQAAPVVLPLWPAPGSDDLPTNVQRLYLVLSRPVPGLIAPGKLWLRSDRNTRVPLIAEPLSGGCRTPSWHPHCVRVKPATPLEALTTWRLFVVDGQDELAPAASGAAPQGEPWFATGMRRDDEPAELFEQVVRYADDCALLSVRLSEPTDLSVRGAASDEVVTYVGREELAIGIRALSQDATVQLVDVSGNARPSIVLDPPRPSPRPPQIIITEVLANPRGPDPTQELVELYNASPAAVDLGGWILDDGDDGQGIVLLPSSTVAPGEFAVIVPASYDLNDGRDAAPNTSAKLIRVSSNLGQRGLSNAGESLVLRDPAGVLISSFGLLRPPAAPLDGQSLERVSLDSCDLPSSWRPNPQHGSTPGRLTVWPGH